MYPAHRPVFEGKVINSWRALEKSIDNAQPLEKVVDIFMAGELSNLTLRDLNTIATILFDSCSPTNQGSFQAIGNTRDAQEIYLKERIRAYWNTGTRKERKPAREVINLEDLKKILNILIPHELQTSSVKQIEAIGTLISGARHMTSDLLSGLSATDAPQSINREAS